MRLIWKKCETKCTIFSAFAFNKQKETHHSHLTLADPGRDTLCSVGSASALVDLNDELLLTTVGLLCSAALLSSSFSSSSYLFWHYGFD